MKKKIISITAAILILAGILTGIFVHRYVTRTIYNEQMVYGTSAGNFYNGGLFCESGDYVYFSNPLDSHKLYRMTPDGQEAEKLSDDSACFINADAHYLYYARNGQSSDADFSFLNFNTNSLCRMPLKGGNPLILDEAPALYAVLAQNSIYYIHYDKETASTLYKVTIDGTDKKKITAEPLLLSPGQEGTLCYAGVSYNHNIALWNPETDTGTEIYQGTCYLPIDTDSSIYFLDAADNYTLSRYEKDTGSVSKLTQCRIDCYNLTEEYVYYQKNDAAAPALCRMRLDGSFGEETVMEGTFTGIHTTSRYVYFSSFQNPDLVFQTPANGSIQVENLSLSYKN